MKSYHPSSGWTVNDQAWTLETKLVVTGRCTSILHAHYDNGIKMYHRWSHRFGF